MPWNDDRILKETEKISRWQKIAGAEYRMVYQADVLNLLQRMRDEHLEETEDKYRGIIEQIIESNQRIAESIENLSKNVL